ncbi:head maturation protease, ClpP-related [Serinibacter salmoneus]|uniref:ATP-dependent Clp protease proteolytic subunit n=1 Tax=Serinibacter salmoneus TaxID=556530 RepID=A0A2A9D0F7_9MICO|nr:head maturation protease, ClpP-related [Serinibacter salmoneus]PFG19866.1 ATP-dependent protease ClpP protease subunit [Serinibacter salmoneus]
MTRSTMDPRAMPPGGYRMEATGQDTADVYVYGTIGAGFWSDGVSASDFVRELADLDVSEINLWVNSPGGLVKDGVSMMNAIARHSARVVAHVDGLAASAASFLIMAADEVVMGRGSELMIHDASNIAWGDARVLRNVADQLDKTSATIASVYAERAGGTAQEWREAMLEETWYSDEEAVAAGLADKVLTLTGDTASTDEADEPANAVAQLARAAGFEHAGRGDAPAPYMPRRTAAAAGPRPANLNGALAALASLSGVATPPAPPVDTHSSTGSEDGPMVDFMKGVRERLGVPADANLNDEQVLAALDEALAEQSDEPTTTSASALPDGAVAIDSEVLAGLKADAAAGRAARDEQEKSARAALVEAAVADGRILPRQREGWLNKLTHEKDAAEALASLEPGLVPTSAKGFTGGVDEARDEDGDLYAKAWGAPEQKEAE